MIAEATLTDHIIALREKVATMESEVRHLAHDQAVHSGSLALTGNQLAHIAQSLRDAHRLIQRIQQDVEDLSSLAKKSRIGSLLRDLMPTAGPALLGLLVLGLTLLGKSDLAAKLAAMKP